MAKAYTTPLVMHPVVCEELMRPDHVQRLNTATRLVSEHRRIAETVILRCNVDYSGSGSTWGCHESYLHRCSPRLLPAALLPHLVSRVIYTGAGGFEYGGRRPSG